MRWTAWSRPRIAAFNNGHSLLNVMLFLCQIPCFQLPKSPSLSQVTSVWSLPGRAMRSTPNRHPINTFPSGRPFLLPSRDPYPLPDWNEFGEFLTAALTFTNALRCITVTVNGTEKLKIVKSIRQPPRRVVQPQAPANATAAATSKASFLWSSIVGGATSSSSNTQSSSGVFYLPRGKDAGGGIYESLVRVTVRVDGTAAAYMDAQYVAATARTKIGPDMARRMQRVTKKEPPKECLVQVFLNHSAPTAKLVEEGQQQQQQQNSTTTTTAATSSQKKRALSIAQSFAPVHGQGRIFIGFRTSQSTGLAAHVAAPFVPTVGELLLLLLLRRGCAHECSRRGHSEGLLSILLHLNCSSRSVFSFRA